jgi:hypothetical protein
MVAAWPAHPTTPHHTTPQHITPHRTTLHHTALHDDAAALIALLYFAASCTRLPLSPAHPLLVAAVAVQGDTLLNLGDNAGALTQFQYVMSERVPSFHHVAVCRSAARCCRAGLKLLPTFPPLLASYFQVSRGAARALAFHSRHVTMRVCLPQATRSLCLWRHDETAVHRLLTA